MPLQKNRDENNRQISEIGQPGQKLCLPKQKAAPLLHHEVEVEVKEELVGYETADLVERKHLSSIVPVDGVSVVVLFIRKMVKREFAGVEVVEAVDEDEEQGDEDAVVEEEYGEYEDGASHDVIGECHCGFKHEI